MDDYNTGQKLLAQLQKIAINSSNTTTWEKRDDKHATMINTCNQLGAYNIKLSINYS